MERVDRAAPLTIKLWVWLVLLSVEVRAGAATLDACRAWTLAMRRDVRKSWRRRLLDDREIWRWRGSDLGIGAMRREGERLDQVGVCLHHVSASSCADDFARLGGNQQD